MSEVDGKIYVIGGAPRRGLSVGLALQTIEMYDPTTDAWIQKADTPTGRLLHSASAVNGVIYAIGGTKERLTEYFNCRSI